MSCHNGILCWGLFYKWHKLTLLWARLFLLLVNKHGCSSELVAAQLPGLNTETTRGFLVVPSTPATKYLPQGKGLYNHHEIEGFAAANYH